MARYDIGERLGSGGFGVVKAASKITDDGTRVLDSELAAKFLAPTRLDDEEAVRRFQGEVKIQEEDLDHPNVMEVLESRLSDSPPWFVMPYAEANLQDVLDGGKAGDRSWAVHVFAQVLEGLAHAHQRGVLHRDIKPENILFCGGVPKVSDFGLGKQLESNATTLTQSSAFLGTERYMAPEQFADAKRVGPPADVYATGKVFLQMLTGRVPDMLHVDLDPAPREFRFFIGKCCRREENQRYADAGEALEAFRLMTAEPEFVGPPMEGAEQLVDDWTGATSPEDKTQVLRQLDEHLTRNAQEQDLFRRVVPRLPDKLVEMYMDDLADVFPSMLAVYDGHITGGLPFGYCDVVANFYARIFRSTEDLDIQRIVLARLIEVGASHNRWHVGDVVADLLEDITDISTSMMAAEAIEADAYHAEWYWEPFCKAKTLPRAISQAFEKVTAT